MTIPGTCTITGKNTTVKVLGHSTVMIVLHDQQECKQRITLNKVLYVPNATMRFFAPITALHKGYTLSIGSDKWSIHRDGEELLKEHPDHAGLF